MQQGDSPLLKEEVASEDIAEVVAKWTGIPVAPMLESDKHKLLHLEEELGKEFLLELPIAQWLADDDDLHEEPLREKIIQEMANSFAQKEELIGADMMRRVEKGVMLEVLDGLWKEHLAAMDYLRKGIGLRGYAQKNPKQEYLLFEDSQNPL